MRFYLVAVGMAAATLGLAQTSTTFYNNATPAGLTQEGLRTSARPAGGSYSELQPTNNIFGYTGEGTLRRLADDFQISGTGAFIEGVNVFCYVVDSTPAAMTGGAMEIRSGSEVGPVVAVGTFSPSSLTTIYRIQQPITVSDDRRIQRVRFTFPGTFLSPGNYWITYHVSNSVSGNVFFPSLTKVGSLTTAGANAKQQVVSSGVWSNVTDTGGPQDFAFWVEGTPCVSSMYAYDQSGRIVYNVNPISAAGSTEITYPAGIPIYGSLTYDITNENFYVSSTNDHTLSRMNSSFTITSVGNYGIGTPFVHGLEYHESLDTLFGTQSASGGSNLLRISKNTGAATIVGPLGVAGTGFRALGYHQPSNRLYMIDNSTDSLYIVNTTTGNASFVAAVTGPASVSGMAYLPDLGRMYAVESNGNLWTINLASGAGTFVGDIGAGNFLGLVVKNDEKVVPNISIVAEGTPFGGNVASLAAQDDNKLFVLMDEFTPNGTVLAGSGYCSNDFRRLYVTIESSATRDDLTEFVDLFNYVSNSYQNIGFSSPALFDTTIRFQAVGNVWGSSARNITKRIRYIPQADIETADGWAAAIDWISTRVIQ